MNKLSTILCFLLPLTLASGGPQEETQASIQSKVSSSQDKKTVKAIRTNEPVYIDGQLTEKDWESGDGKNDFIQFQPQNGEKPKEGTLFIVLYDENNLYIGVYIMEKEPLTVMGKLRRRDDMALSDYIWVSIDTENKGKSAYKFGLNPSGVRFDAYISNDVEVDFSWDGVWDGKVARGFADQSEEESQRRVGWTAEFRIPFSTLQYDIDNTEEWGFNVTRFKGSTFEQMWWKNKEVTEPGLVSHFGKITGISNIKSAGKFEFLPGSVITASSDDFESESALIGSSRLHYNISTDFKYDITTSTRLEASINPDFGQAEVDPAENNLSVFESRFPEKRTFFVNGSDIFSTPFELFYSRRIGRSTDSGLFVPVNIAGKLTGKAGNTTFGVISALTGAKDEYGKSIHLVGRVKQTINKGNTNFGILFTHLNGRQHYDYNYEEEKYDIVDSLKTPVSLGLDWGHQFFKNQFFISGQYAQSKIDTLTGHGVMASLSKIGGKWNFSLDVDMRSKNFEINDLGFLDRNNMNSYSMGHSFTTDPIWKFQETNTTLNMWYQETPEEIISKEKLELGMGLSIGTSITLLNQWSFGLDFSKKLPGYDDMDTRRLGNFGSVIEDPGTISLSSWIAPKPGKKVSQQLSVYGGKDDYASKWYGLSYSLELAPKEHFSISISPSYSWNFDESFWIYTWDDLTPMDTSLYGSLTNQTVSIGIRGNYSFTPDMSLQLYAEPFLSLGDIDNNYTFFYNPKSYTFHSDESGIPWDQYLSRASDFNIKNLNWQSVFRWEYRPGSVFFFVWSFSSAESQELLDLDIPKSFKKLFDQVATHQFLIKYNYWMKL